VLTRRHLLLAGAISALLRPSTAAARKAAPAAAATVPPTAAKPEPPPAALLGQARSWGYQLQNYDLRAVASSEADVLVVDYSIAGDDPARLGEAAVRKLQRKPDGSRRVVLAYLSIGEAEEYRYYWKKDWIETDDSAEAAPGARTGTPPAPGGKSPPAPAAEEPAKPARWLSPKAPAWLGDENETWSGNFAVKYWEPAWQALIVGAPGCYLDRILAAGFDGVYLDRVDAYYEYADQRSTAPADMIAFVRAIADYARAKRAGFLVVPQNGEELLTRPDYVATIDAIAKEDLLYGSPEQSKPNSSAQISNTIGWLSHARLAGRPVLVVEYLDDKAEIDKARRQLANLGYVATFAPRMLDSISPDALPPRAE
jgi:cysteinyl-tRNA synthetase